MHSKECTYWRLMRNLFGRGNPKIMGIIADPEGYFFSGCIAQEIVLAHYFGRIVVSCKIFPPVSVIRHTCKPNAELLGSEVNLIEVSGQRID